MSSAAATVLVFLAPRATRHEPRFFGLPVAVEETHPDDPPESRRRLAAFGFLSFLPPVPTIMSLDKWG
jgi:hypothetical protein